MRGKLTPGCQQTQHITWLRLWWSGLSLDAFQISDIVSDRVCGVRFKRDEDSWLSIIGVYLPCADLGMDYYRETLIELERVISDSATHGPVIVAGDFNAHLGHMWGPRGSDAVNSQGLMLGELLNGCKLHAASLSGITSGPEYTYHSGDKFTTIDYIFTDIEASSSVDQCWTHEEDVLNQSDHLSLSLKLSCNIATQLSQDFNCINIDWSKAGKSEAITLFQKAVKDRFSPFIGKTCCDVEQLNDEIQHVASVLKDAAEAFLPHCKAPKATRFNDKTLSQLCAKSKLAWREWSDGGRPCEGPLYEAKCSARKELRKRIKMCEAMKERKRVQRREHLFRTNAPSRFKTPQGRKKSRCTRLRVDGNLISDPIELLEAWSTHFETLAQSQIHTQTGLQESQTELTSLASASYQREDTFLDVPFSVEEVEHILHNRRS